MKKRKFVGASKVKSATTQARRNRPPPLSAQDEGYIPTRPELIPAVATTDETGHSHGHANAVLAQEIESHENNNDQINPSTPSLLASSSSVQDQELYSVDDWPHNRKGFRYGLCAANPVLTSVLYSCAEIEPKCARVSYEDRSPQAFLSKDCLTVSTFRGFRSARANVFMSEGDWFFEVKILSNEVSTQSNSPAEPSPSPTNGLSKLSGGHVRLGIARREASLEAPVGHDAYGYGLRDATGEKVHVSRPVPFMNEPFGIGDVIGLHVSLPSRPETFRNVFRDKFPIWYKGQHFFEFLDYLPSKQMDSLMLPTAAYKKKFKEDKSSIPTISDSFVRVYKNGRDMGIAFSDLKDFLPPNSKLNPSLAVHENSNDGCLGYYPMLSVFKGGTARFNFGPKFDYPPEQVVSGQVRPLSQRYDEQIAEDVVFDLIDQVGYEVQDKLDDEAQALRDAEIARQEQELRERAQRVKMERKSQEPSISAIPSSTPNEEVDQTPMEVDGNNAAPSAIEQRMSIQSMISPTTANP